MLRFRPQRLWRLMVWAILLVAPLSTVSIQAQPAPQLISRGVVWVVAPAPQAPALPEQLAYRQHLPLISARGAPATVAFFGRTGELRSGPAVQFDYGITALEYEIQIMGAANLPYREEWSVDGQSKPQLGSSGIIPASPATLTNALLYSTGEPLPRGSYRLRLLIDGFVAADRTVVIR